MVIWFYLWKIKKIVMDIGRIVDKGAYNHTYGIPTGFIAGYGISITGAGNLYVDDGSYMGTRSAIHIEKGYEVSIGRNVAISHNVRIYTSSRRGDFWKNPEQKLGSVVIGDNVWIGANVLVMPRSNIPSNTTVAANTIVKEGDYDGC